VWVSVYASTGLSARVLLVPCRFSLVQSGEGIGAGPLVVGEFSIGIVLYGIGLVPNSVYV
jgi:hypothetical protein